MLRTANTDLFYIDIVLLLKVAVTREVDGLKNEASRICHENCPV